METLVTEEGFASGFLWEKVEISTSGKAFWNSSTFIVNECSAVGKAREVTSSYWKVKKKKEKILGNFLLWIVLMRNQ